MGWCLGGRFTRGDWGRLRPGVLPDVFPAFSGFFAPRREACIHAAGLAPQAGQQLLERGHAHLLELESSSNMRALGRRPRACLQAGAWERGVYRQCAGAATNPRFTGLLCRYSSLCSSISSSVIATG